MRMYYSGGAATEKKDAYIVSTIRHRLLSYLYVTKSVSNYYWGRKEKDGISLMLDSGAFSVWNKGKAIDPQKYLDYALSTQEHWDYIIALDEIPGSPGHKDVSLEERNHCADVSWRRYMEMIEAGIPAEKAMPVFHQGESVRFLDRMVENRCPIVGISPANDRSPAEKREWLDEIMEVICDSDRRPKIRIHGLAVTSPTLMLDYPWYSVDSATWTILPGFGGMLVPAYKGPNDYDYENPTVFHSGRESNKNSHINAVSPMTKELVLSYLKECDFIAPDVTEMPDDRWLRMRVTITFFDHLARMAAERELKWRSPCRQSNLGLHIV